MLVSVKVLFVESAVLVCRVNRGSGKGEDMNSGPRGKFWFSEAEKKERLFESRPALVSTVVIAGKEVEYTEWKFGENIDDPSEWDDAIYLGEVK